MMFLNKDFASLPPLGDDSAPGHRRAIRLAGTGATEVSNDSPLMPQRLYTLSVAGSVAVRASFRATVGIANAVATTDFVIPGNSDYTFLAEVNSDQGYGSIYVYVEAADGASNYECFLVQSGR